ncbi:MAG: iron-containing alcohol dehydrogenase, partial [Staphylothermus sp.]|nr:iron-containing alcohol dehydrogenase [Staphylothermus sp.]
MIKFNVYNGGVKLYFGLNTINNASKYLTGFKKLIIVTGKRSAKISGALDDILKILDEKGIEYSIYNEIRPNPV